MAQATHSNSVTESVRLYGLRHRRSSGMCMYTLNGGGREEQRHNTPERRGGVVMQKRSRGTVFVSPVGERFSTSW